ncbi:MAG: RelA/SpoT domain-containing protein, partial [Myxococcota bacterium]
MTDIRRLYARERELLKDFLGQVLHELEGLRYNRGLSQIHTIKGRIKSASAILDKLSRKEVRWSDGTIVALSATMPDVVGARIICLFRDDVNQVVELLTSQDALPFEVIDREEWVWGRDWAEANQGHPMAHHKKLKPSGYT